MTALILGDLLYMTATGMTMAFLFLKSRMPRRRTILIFFATVLLLMAAEVALTFAFSVYLVLRLYGLLVHLPTLLVTALLSRYRGWRLLFQVADLAALLRVAVPEFLFSIVFVPLIYAIFHWVWSRTQFATLF